jgi:hypothetical protein
MEEDITLDGVVFADAVQAGADGDTFAHIADEIDDTEVIPSGTFADSPTDDDPINGNTAEIDTTVSVSAGDRVIIALDSNGTPTVIGVVGEGDETAQEIDYAQQWAVSAIDAAAAAQTAADEAAATAEAVNQHFWSDTSGAHVTDVTQEEWAAAVDDGFSDLSANKQYSNVLLNSLGMLLRSALNNLVSITRSAIAFFDTAGDVVATFGTSGATIGKAAKTHIGISNNVISLVGYNQTTDEQAALTIGAEPGTYGLESTISAEDYLYIKSDHVTTLSAKYDVTGDYDHALSSVTTAARTTAGVNFCHASLLSHVWDNGAGGVDHLSEINVTPFKIDINSDAVFLNNERLRAVKSVEYSSGAVNWSGGTIGTRAAQNSVNIEISGWTPVSVCISYVQASATFQPVVFFANTASTSNYTSVYCNFYRCTTAAYSHNTPLRFTVTYIKD